VWHVRGTLEVHGRRLHGGFRGARGKVKRKKAVVIMVVHVWCREDGEVVLVVIVEGWQKRWHKVTSVAEAYSEAVGSFLYCFIG